MNLNSTKEDIISYPVPEGYILVSESFLRNILEPDIMSLLESSCIYTIEGDK